MSDDVASWIDGLMVENSESVGFLPFVSLREQYVANERYVLQTDERGRRVGYLLHGAPQYGQALNIAQHCIQTDRRNHGYGEAALEALIERARLAGVSVLTARCRVTLDALGFWLSQGFEIRSVVPGGQRRGKDIARLWLPVNAPLLEPVA